MPLVASKNLSSVQLYSLYGGLGTILTVVAQSAGLLLRPTGIYWQANRENTYLVSSQVDIMLRVLGYNRNSLELGFSNESKLFTFISESTYYNPRAYFPRARLVGDLKNARRNALYRRFEAWLKPQHLAWEHWRPLAPTLEELAIRAYQVPAALLWAGPDFFERYQTGQTEEPVLAR